MQSLDRRNRPSEDEYPYTTLSVAEAMPLYRKIDPEFIFIKVESKDEPFLIDPLSPPTPDNLDVRTLWHAVMYARKPHGTVIAVGHNWYKNRETAMRVTCMEFPIVAVLTGPGKFEYPFYDERKGLLMAQAEERRVRRQAKVVAHLNLMLGIIQTTGGL